MTALGEAVIQAVRCPECNKPPGEPCVYLWPAGLDREFLHYRSPKQQARAALTGTPTKRPHNGRYELFDKYQRNRRYRERVPLPLPATAAVRATARAEVEYDRREYEQMRTWLAHYGSILWSEA